MDIAVNSPLIAANYLADGKIDASCFSLIYVPSRSGENPGFGEEGWTPAVGLK